MFLPNRERLSQPSIPTERPMPSLSFLTGEWSGRGELEGVASQLVQYECHLRIEPTARPGELVLQQQIRLLTLPQAQEHPAFWKTGRLETVSPDRYRFAGTYGGQDFRLAGQLFLPASSVQFRRLTFQETNASAAEGWTIINFFERQRQLRYVFENYDTRWHTSRFRLEARLTPVGNS